MAANSVLSCLAILTFVRGLSCTGTIATRTGNHDVALENANVKNLTMQQLELFMKDNDIDTAWVTDMEVCRLERWTWEDGRDHTDHITKNGHYRIRNQMCAIAARDLTIDDRDCGTLLDYFCLFRNVTYSNATCKHIHGDSLCLFKDKQNYFAARDSCIQKKGLLAIPTPNIAEEELVSVLTSPFYFQQDNGKAWIGSRKIDICMLPNKMNRTFARNINIVWLPDQPNFRFSCLIWKLDNQSIKMMSENCSKTHAYLVAQGDKATKVKTVSEPAYEPTNTTSEPAYEPTNTTSEPAYERTNTTTEPACEPTNTTSEPAYEPTNTTTRWEVVGPVTAVVAVVFVVVVVVSAGVVIKKKQRRPANTPDGDAQQAMPLNGTGREHAITTMIHKSGVASKLASDVATFS